MFSSLALLVAAIFLASGVSTGQGSAVQMRWCVKSAEEMKKCEAFERAVGEAAAEFSPETVNFSCVMGTSAKNCMEKIQSGTADLITLDGGEIATAGKNYSLVPLVAEDYYNIPGLDGVNYNAVAVAKKSRTDVTFRDLKDKKTCHTGAGKTAGWNVPVGTLLRLGLMDQDESCKAYVSAGKYFKQSCVPNVKTRYPDAPDNLCDLCKDECTTAGKYSDYSGAFKCMADDVGDVAFIKHTTVAENTDDPSQYVYLCTNGEREETWQDCYLATVPAHAVVTKSGHDHNSDYKKVLVKASELFGINQTNSTGFQLFNSTKYEGKDLLFKDSTKTLVALGQDRNTYKSFLGNDYLQDLKELDSCPTTAPTTAPTASSTAAEGKMNKPQYTVTVVSFVAMVMALFLFK